MTKWKYNKVVDTEALLFVLCLRSSLLKVDPQYSLQ